MRRTVLIVEDHPDTTDVLLDALRLKGWDAIAVGSGEKALQFARSIRFDLVVADLLLPGIDGEALERAFREESALAKIPFVFITGFGPAVQRFGRDRVLLKPFSTSELLAVMERAHAAAGPDLN